MILGVLFVLFKHTSQLEINGDDLKHTFQITPHSNINLYESAHYLLYTFDLDSMHYIATRYKNLERVCKNQTELLSPLISEIETNMNWKIYKPFFLREFVSD